MGSTFASGLLTTAFLGLVLVLGQDTPMIESLSPPAEPVTIIEGEEYIELAGCEEIGVEPVEVPESSNERIELVAPQPEPTPGTNGSTSGSR